MMIRRLSLVSVVATLSTLVTVAPPAAASHVAAECVELTTAPGLPPTTASVCIAADTGLYEPVTITCSTIYGCWARLTAGHHGTAEIHGEVCVDGPGVAPLCVTLGTGEIPLVTIPPQSICVYGSPWAPPCEPDDQ